MTRNDPRHALNGGGAAPVVNIKTVNAVDSASVLDHALSSRAGEKVFMNFIRANKGAVKTAMG